MNRGFRVPATTSCTFVTTTAIHASIPPQQLMHEADCDAICYRYTHRMWLFIFGTGGAELLLRCANQMCGRCCLSELVYTYKVRPPPPMQSYPILSTMEIIKIFEWGHNRSRAVYRLCWVYLVNLQSMIDPQYAL